MGERFTIPFVLNPELVEGAKHEWANGSLTAVFRMKEISVRSKRWGTTASQAAYSGLS